MWRICAERWKFWIKCWQSWSERDIRFFYSHRYSPRKWYTLKMQNKFACLSNLAKIVDRILIHPIKRWRGQIDKVNFKDKKNNCVRLHTFHYFQYFSWKNIRYNWYKCILYNHFLLICKLSVNFDLLSSLFSHKNLKLCKFCKYAT